MWKSDHSAYVIQTFSDENKLVTKKCGGEKANFPIRQAEINNLL
jgi:hypothetical protein